MKKFFWSFLAMMTFVLFPNITRAVIISNVTLEGSEEGTVGEEINTKVNINLSGLTLGNDSTVGIIGVQYDVKYDDTVLEASGINNSVFETTLYYTEDENTKQRSYFVFSEITGAPVKNSCVQGELYCGDYTTDLSFFVNKANKTSTTVEISNVVVYLLDITGITEESSVDDLSDYIVELKSTASKKITIAINQSSSGSVTPPKSIASKESKSQAKKSISSNKAVAPTTSKKTSTKMSDNADLKSLTIKGYDISFDKNRTEYTIYIKEDVNKLDISVQVDDKKAKYKIIGGADLKTNKYQTIVLVTAESGKTKAYSIVSKIRKDDDLDQEIVEDDKKDKKFKIDNRILMYIGIGLGCLFALLLILFIIEKIKDHKLNKMLDKL